MKKLINFLNTFAILLLGLGLLWGVSSLTPFNSPQEMLVPNDGDQYLVEVYEKTHVPNIVSGILADYRNFDTFMEATVVLIAGLAVISLLDIPKTPMATSSLSHGYHPPKKRPNPFLPTPKDPLIEQACLLLIPPIQLFGFYVLCHGHHSPGGGFQAGVILGASYILLAIGLGLRRALDIFPVQWGQRLAIAGVLLYGGVGLLCVLCGGHFFEYEALGVLFPFISKPMLHSWGILVVEIGVTATVMSVMFLVYAYLASKGRLQEGL